MSTHLDLDALAMLVAVAETGGFTAAGARLGRTQSAVSGRIQDLEATLGKQLLERSIEKASASGATVASIMVESVNVDAYHLYRRFGFVDWERRPA